VQARLVDDVERPSLRSRWGSPRRHIHIPPTGCYSASPQKQYRVGLLPTMLALSSFRLRAATAKGRETSNCAKRPRPMDSYLELAEKVLKRARRPLDARQILTSAYRLSIVPNGLYGKTQHKTLHARLAEDIRSQRWRSQFIRTDPGRFFLRSLLADPAVPEIHKREYPARPRSDQLRNFDVLCVRTADAEVLAGSGVPDLALLQTAPLFARRLADIYGDTSFVFIRTFVIVERHQQIVARRSFSKLADTMASRLSLGAIGFVKDQDKTMFSADRYGLLEASLRTLSDQLDLDNAESDFISSKRLLNVLGVARSPTDAGENSIVAISICHCPRTFDPISRYNDSRNLFWMSPHHRANDPASLDPWSRDLLVRGAFDRVPSPTLLL
jgi:HB1, ASXL, restriction endonuclease HTH domain